MLFPESESPDKVHPVVLDILRSYLLLCLRKKLWKEALGLLKRMIAVHAAMEADSSLCKAFLTTTVIQLTMGDFVQVSPLPLLSSPLHLASSSLPPLLPRPGQ